MNDRFKFRAVLKTDTHSIIVEPYYILNNGYLVNIDDLQNPFESKYPDDCFWEFIEEIEKQENCQEVSTDSEIIIFDSFDGLIQSTGLKDKNGKLIYEGDIVKNHGWWDASGPAGYEKDTCVVEFNKSVCGFTPMCNYDCDCCVYHEAEDLEVIGNIYENEDLLKCENQ